jgi:glutamyl-tRNA synthetase
MSERPTDRPIRTRIAPSPTGDPHVGTGYMGLINLVHAKQHGGQFVLRIDDTDRTRYRKGSEEAIFAALRWLGIEWDEGPDKGGPHGPYRQSERSAIYAEHTSILLERGGAYRCFCSAERLDAVRAEQRANKQIPRYDRHCRDLDPAEGAQRAQGGEAHVVRLKMPTEGDVVIQDLLRGDVTLKQDNFQDQVLIKQDGFPTYHMASVIDDHLMQISHIIRAEEWLSSAATHKVLFEAFGWEMPTICHMPLLRNADKSKISKRKNPTSILHYRDAGILPEALLNFLGLMGWSGLPGEGGAHQEKFTVAEMMEVFRLEDIALGGPVFDQAKLRHLNGEYLRAMAPADYVARVKDFLLRDLDGVCGLLQERAHTLGEFAGHAAPFLGDVSHATPETRKRPVKEQEPVAGLVPKGKEAQEVWFALRLVQDALDKVEDWTPEGLEPVCRKLATDPWTGWKVRDLFSTLRVAVTGRTESPGLFETMTVLGKPRCLGRISAAMWVLGQPGKKALKRWEKEQKAKAAEREAAERGEGGGDSA